MPTQKQISDIAKLMGSKGGQSRSPAKLAAIAENAKKGGAPKLCTCGHKRNAHTRVLHDNTLIWCTVAGCGCQEYRARE